MQTYCEQDVILTKKLFTLLKNKNIPSQVLALEQRFAQIISLQEQRGIKFNRKKAINLGAELIKQKFKIEDELRQIFPDKKVKTTFIPKVNNKERGYIKGKPFTKVTVIPFKPSSRQQVIKQFQELYNWQPEEFTDKGQPKINDEILRSLACAMVCLLEMYGLTSCDVLGIAHNIIHQPSNNNANKDFKAIKQYMKSEWEIILNK